jgi:hypothetical protein
MPLKSKLSLIILGLFAFFVLLEIGIRAGDYIFVNKRDAGKIELAKEYTKKQ